VTDSDLEELVRRYDSSMDDWVSFIEFVDQVTPMSPISLTSHPARVELPLLQLTMMNAVHSQAMAEIACFVI
jgi:hypothetical protein